MLSVLLPQFKLCAVASRCAPHACVAACSSPQADIDVSTSKGREYWANVIKHEMVSV